MRAALRLSWSLGCLLAATLLFLPFHALATRTGFGNAGDIAVRWNRLVVAALGWRVRVTGILSAERPLLVASNHVSWGDILLISAQADVVFVAKREVKGWPLFGLLARLQNTVFIDREAKRRVGAQAGDIARRLGQGRPLVLFPEGTTADGNHPLPFHTSLFAAVPEGAGATGRVAVQPLGIAYTRLYGVPLGRPERDTVAWTGERTLLGHLWLLARKGPLDVTLAFGEPAWFGADAARKTVAARAESAVRALMADALRG